MGTEIWTIYGSQINPDSGGGYVKVEEEGENEEIEEDH